MKAKLSISINHYEHFTIKGNDSHIWATDYSGLRCVLQETENPWGEGDCQVIIIADDREHILEAMQYPDVNEANETLKVRENYEEMGLDASCLQNVWAIHHPDTDGKYLLLTPLELEALVPMTKAAAEQLFQIAVFKLQQDVREENARILFEVTKNCEKFLY